MAEETWVRLRLLRNVLFGLAGVIFGLGLIFLARSLLGDEIFRDQGADTLQFSFQYLLAPAIPASILFAGGVVVQVIGMLYDDWAELNSDYGESPEAPSPL